MTVKSKDLEGQKCYCCGQEAQRHPFVVVMQAEDGDGWVAEPVCFTCWRFEEQRPINPKGHYFSADQAEVALRHAGSSTIGFPGRPVKP